ncbi:hypothetical protein ACHAWT_002950 [Skeletonema menzelii]
MTALPAFGFDAALDLLVVCSRVNSDKNEISWHRLVISVCPVCKQDQKQKSIVQLKSNEADQII